MSGPTKIEWADATWNPVLGCTKVSAGCQHCYAERQAVRFRGRVGFPADNPFRLTLHPDRLDEPLHWRKPRTIFVCSMSDLFHPDVPDEFIAKVWNMMSVCSWHAFQVLTKRPERMQAWISRCGNGGGFGWITHDNTPPALAYEGTGIVVGRSDEWPLPNVWLGVSVEDQATADERIHHLLCCPAAVRFVSYEPALGPVDFRRIRQERPSVHGLVPIAGGDTFDVLRGERVNDIGIGYDAPRLDWIIAGGESGPKARPAHPDWFRSVRDQCQAAGVPFFFKQWGEWAHAKVFDAPMAGGRGFEDPRGGRCSTELCYLHSNRYRLLDEDLAAVRVGKKAAGHLLDGREWNEFPESRG